MKKNKPDNIVFDEKSNKYNASILPYASSVGAPSIKIEDNKSWKERGVSKVNKKISLKFEELKSDYEKLINDFKWNEIIYNSKFTFILRNNLRFFFNLSCPANVKGSHS